MPQANRPPTRRPNRIIESMAVQPRGILIATALVAVVVFAVIQDRVTAAGARRYVALQRAALAGRGSAVTVDEIMRPAIAQSVHEGLLWGGVVLVSGVAIAAAVAARAVAGRNPERVIRDPQLAATQRVSDSGSPIADSATRQR
jgi:hypothetical protein